MKLTLKGRSISDNYDQLDGDSAFAKAVNKVVADYWVETERVKPVETAIFEVLADFYNEFNPLNR